MIFNVVDQLLELRSTTPLLLGPTGLTCNMYSHRIEVVEHQRQPAERKKPNVFSFQKRSDMF
jgi:hypothetical protein